MRGIIAAILLIFPSGALAADVTGNWLTQDKSAIVSIGRCGQSMCGNIARILVSKPGMPTTDVHNPAPGLRRKPLVGLRILDGFVRKGEQRTDGRIYDPESGKTYRSRMKLNPDGSLKVSGCVAFICKSQHWTRAR